jgi:RecA-family ATPase
MRVDNIGQVLTGQPLIEAMSAIKNKRKVVAEGFLYEQTILMIAADPGTGKSTVSTQVAVELSAGLPIFGIYKVPKPVKVLYVQTERSLMELIERLEIIHKIMPIVKENLYITSEYQMFNLLNFEHVKVLIECILRDCPGVEVIFIDPIYPMVSGGLSKDEPASAFTKGMNLVQKATGAILWYNHHTVKPSYSPDGAKMEKQDPFYGSQWLKAHVTGSYYMKEQGEGVSLIKKKDNYNLMPHQIDLEYNPETELCTIPFDKMPALDKVKHYMTMRKIDQKEFTFKDIQAQSHLCTRTLRECMASPNVISRLISINTNHNKRLYKISQDEPKIT